MKEQFMREMEKVPKDLNQQLEKYEHEYPLGGSDTYRADKIRIIKGKIEGLQGAIAEVIKDPPFSKTEEEWAETLRKFRARANEIKDDIESLPKAPKDDC